MPPCYAHLPQKPCRNLTVTDHIQGKRSKYPSRIVLGGEEYVERSNHEHILILTTVKVMIMQRELYIIRIGLSDFGNQRGFHLHRLHPPPNSRILQAPLIPRSSAGLPESSPKTQVWNGTIPGCSGISSRGRSLLAVAAAVFSLSSRSLLEVFLLSSSSLGVVL